MTLDTRRSTSPPVFDSLMKHRAIDCVYQPVVALGDGRIVGFEALARGPRGTPWHSAAALIAAATRAGRLPELDWICRAAACRGALAADLPPDTALFINIEPASSATASPADLDEIVQEAAGRLRIIAEVTERAIADDPAALLTTTDQLRGQSVLIALDDVGADPASQAMMPLLAPDVIKIDRSVIQSPGDPGTAGVIAAVQAEALRGGAVILAEGIETRQHLAFAASIGATLGQGFYLGMPGPLAARGATSTAVFPRRSSAPATARTPFDTMRAHGATSRVSAKTMVLLSREMEDRRVHAAEPTILLATFQHAGRFDPATRSRYSRLSAHTILTAVFAVGMDPDPAPNVRGYALAPDDPLATEWTVVVIGSRRAEGLFARPASSGEPRIFDVVVSDDRDLVLAAARPLIQRIPPRQARR